MSQTEVARVTQGPEAAQAELVSVRRQLDDVEAALERLDQGTYGTCEECGSRLADEQLEREPAARHCPVHASGH